MSKKQGSKHDAVGHPMHPAVVHFPITLFPISSIFLILWFWLGNPFHLHAAYWTFLFGAFFVIPVVATGFRDMRHTEVDNDSGYRLLFTHMIIGGIIGFLSIISGIYYLLHKPMDHTALIPGFAVISFLLTLMVIVQGFMGGLMVYTHRMGVEGHTIK